MISEMLIDADITHEDKRGCRFPDCTEPAVDGSNWCPNHGLGFNVSQPAAQAPPVTETALVRWEKPTLQNASAPMKAIFAGVSLACVALTLFSVFLFGKLSTIESKEAVEERKISNSIQAISSAINGVAGKQNETASSVETLNENFAQFRATMDHTIGNVDQTILNDQKSISYLRAAVDELQQSSSKPKMPAVIIGEITKQSAPRNAFESKPPAFDVGPPVEPSTAFNPASILSVGARLVRNAKGESEYWLLRTVDGAHSDRHIVPLGQNKETGNFVVLDVTDTGKRESWVVTKRGEWRKP